MRRLLLLFGLIMLSAGILSAQTALEKQKIVSKSNVKFLNEFAKQKKVEAKANKEKAVKKAKEKGLPVTFTDDDGSFNSLMRVTDDGYFIYYQTYNVDAAKSTRTNFLHNGGGLGLNLEGQDMTTYIWDGGHGLVSHQEYDGTGGTDRLTIMDTYDPNADGNFHAAHVTGTMIASGYVPAAKGMAPQALCKAYDWYSDVSEATTAAANGMLVSNHSYGNRSDLINDWMFGAYDSDSRDWDVIMNNAPFYLMVNAAGNDGNNDTDNGTPLDGNSAYDKLSGHSTSKNSLVVANAQDADIDPAGNLISVTINSSSSEGPTDDYRIKPDITANGTGLYSTYETADDAYASITGTSMASPNTTGTLLLLQQLYNNINSNYMLAATLKGLALHTADDIGPTGPDAVHGWGLLNAKKAVETIQKEGDGAIINELTLNNGGSYSIDVTASGIEDLVASISWNDPAGTANTGTANDKTPVLVNDLDIRITESTNTYYPWRLTSITTNSNEGDNTVDPYERVDISNPSGIYTITVTHKGTLSSPQDFTLIVTGCEESPKAPETNFVAEVLDPVVNNKIVGFYDLTDNLPTSWSWSFSPATVTYKNNTDANSQNPQVAFNAPGLYTVTLVATNAQGSDTKVKTDYINVTSTCTPCYSFGNTAYGTSITNVTFNTINQTSGKPTDGNGNAYSDYTAVSTNLTALNTYNLSLELFPDGDFLVEARVWIDWNQDCYFDETEEYYMGTASANNTPPSLSPLPITVPGYAIGGDTRMRVSVKYQPDGSVSSCETGFDGEVEDYTINVTPIPPSTISSVTPDNGTVYMDGGKDISIQGTNLSDAVVTVGGVEARIISNTDTQIDIELAGGNYSGQDLVVECPGPDGTVTYTTGFTYSSRNAIPVNGGIDGHSTFQYGLEGLLGWWGTAPFDASKTIDVYAGTYAEEVVVPNTLNPTSTNRLVIQNHSGETAIINATGNDYGINTNAVDFVTVSGFSAYGANLANIYATGNSNIIQYNTTYGAAGDNSGYGALAGASGIKVETGTGSSILNNISYANALYGIVVNSDNNIVKNNTLYDNGSLYSGKTNQSFFFDDFENGSDRWSASGGTMTIFNTSNPDLYVSPTHIMGTNDESSVIITSDPIDISGYNALTVSGNIRAYFSALNQANSIDFEYSFDNTNWNPIASLTTGSTGITTFSEYSASNIDPGGNNTLYIRFTAVIGTRNSNDDASDEYWLIDDIEVTGNETVADYNVGAGINVLSGTSNTIENNISYAKTGSAAYYALNTNGNGLTSDYNNYYTSDAGNAPIFEGSSALGVSAWGNAGTDDISENPLFINPGTDFHLQSSNGSYAGGEWPPTTATGGAWVNDAANSPGLDAGNPADDFSNEPSGGTAINQGAYGNTVQASKTSSTPNTAPEIISNGGGATASISVDENQTAVTTVVATDPESDNITYSISGGIDQALFSINASTGELSFVTAPDFENPTDADANNDYVAEVTATDDGTGNLTDVQTITVTILNINESPDITSNGGLATASISVDENQTAVTTVVATDPDSDNIAYSISGGIDQALFSINASTGVLTFLTAPDFENPTDADANNDYVAEVTATDDGTGNLTDVQTITVTILNINESPDITSDGGGATASISVDENQTAVTTVVATDPESDNITYSISGGVDQALFSINASTGELSFVTAPDFENPTDADANNDYVAEVTATDDGTGNLTDVQTITVTVLDLLEAGSYTISGTLKYDNATQSVLSGETIILEDAGTGTSVATTTTNGSGYYEFAGITDGTYEVRGGATLTWSGASSMDVTIYKKHIIGSTVLTGMKLISGDVNNSGSVTSTELPLFLQRIVWMISTFPDVDDWAYSNGNVTVAGSNETVNLQAICYGDANGSYSGAKSFKNVRIENSGIVYANSDGSFELSVKLLSELKDLASVTLEIPFNTDIVEISKVEMMKNNQDMNYYISDGKLRIAYSSLNASDYAVNEDFLRITGTVNNLTDISNVADFAEGEFGDYTDNVISDVVLSIPSLSPVALGTENLEEDILIYPNPANTFINIANVKDSKIEIYNITGSKVISKLVEANADIINIENLSAGSYYIKIYKDNMIYTHKLSVIK